MQVYKRSATRLLRPVVSASAPLISRRHAGGFLKNPIDWVRDKVNPGLMEEQSEAEIEAAKAQARKEGTSNLFEDVVDVAPSESGPEVPQTAKTVKSKAFGKTVEEARPDFHKYSTANFKISHRKLNMLGRQIAGKPIDYAILQMQFSEKRASTRIMNMLATARDHASRYKKLEEGKLVVAEAWITKGKRPPTRMEPRGRGHFGTRTHQNSKMTVVLKEGKTVEQQKAALKKRRLDRIVSAALLREDKPIRNPSSTWGW